MDVIRPVLLKHFNHKKSPQGLLSETINFTLEMIKMILSTAFSAYIRLRSVNYK